MNRATSTTIDKETFRSGDMKAPELLPHSLIGYSRGNAVASRAPAQHTKSVIPEARATKEGADADEATGPDDDLRLSRWLSGAGACPRRREPVRGLRCPGCGMAKARAGGVGTRKMRTDPGRVSAAMDRTPARASMLALPPVPQSPREAVDPVGPRSLQVGPRSLHPPRLQRRHNKHLQPPIM